MTSDTIHRELVRGTLEPESTEDDALAMMILLHTHRIWLSKPVLDDCPGETELPAITQRHASSLVARVWLDRAGKQRTYSADLYWRFNLQGPFEVINDVPPELLARVQLLRDRLARNPLIKRLEPED